MILNQVLIENGLMINVCPLSTIKRMGIDQERIPLSNTVIRAFDGSRKETIGMIHLPVEIGPYEFQVTLSRQYIVCS